jgi:hypothetical protein
MDALAEKRDEGKSAPRHSTTLYGVEGRLLNMSFAERMCAKELIPSPVEIKKARRFAVRSRASSACSFCAIMKRKCSDFRPCARCLRQGRAKTCTSKDVSDDLVQDSEHDIERPFSSLSSIRFVRTSTPPLMNLRNDWSFHIIMKLWTFGYKSSSIANFFNTIPEELCLVTRRALNALQKVSQLQTSLLQKSIEISPEGPTKKIIEDQQQLQSMQTSHAQWERESHIGFFQVQHGLSLHTYSVEGPHRSYRCLHALLR